MKLHSIGERGKGGGAYIVCTGEYIRANGHSYERTCRERGGRKLRANFKAILVERFEKNNN